MYAREYEIIFVARPDVADDDLNTIRNRAASIIGDRAGTILKNEDWGKRKLAYEIDKCNKGHFFLFNFLGGPEMVSELERTLRIDDQILRFLTVKIADRVEVSARIVEEEARRALAATRQETASDYEEMDY
jgi:small subunit ribosomal protein S6